MVSGADPDTGSLYKVEMSDYMASDEEDSSDDGRRSGDLPKLASQYVSKPALSRRSASYQRPDKKTTIHMLDGSQVSFSPKDGDQISIEADELSRSSTLIPENIQNNEDREDYVFTQRQRLEALISAFDREQDKIRSQRDGGSRYYEAQSNGEPRVTQTKSDKSKNQTKYHENHRPTTRNPVSEHQRENQYWNPRQQQNRIEAPTRFKGATKPNMPQNQTQVQPVKKKAAIHRPSEHPQEAQYDTGQRKTLVNTSRRNRRPTSYHGTAPNGPTLQREPTIQIYPQYSVYDPSNGIVGTVIGFCQACLMHQRAIPSEQCSLHHGYGMDLYSMPPHPPSSFERPPTSRALSAPYPGAISMVEDDYHRLMPPPREMRKNSVSPPPYYYSVPPPRRARRNSVSPPLPTPPIEVMPNGNPGPTPIGLNMPPPLPPPNRFDYSQQPRRIDSSRPTSTLDVSHPLRSAPAMGGYPSPRAPPRTSTPLGGYSGPPLLRQQVGGVNVPFTTGQAPWSPHLAPPLAPPQYVPFYESEPKPGQSSNKTNLREIDALVPNRKRSTMQLSEVRSAPLNRRRSKSDIRDVDFPVLDRGQSRTEIHEIKSASSSNNSGASFKWDIHIMNAARMSKPAVALLDTQCQKGNWIAQSLVQRLDELSSVYPLNDPPSLSDANGRPVQASGTITLSFKRHNGNRWHECEFYVLPPSTRHIDVILGVAYIVEHELIVVNDSAHLPILERQKVSKGDKAAIAIAEERRRQEKAALEARRQERAEQDAHRLARQMSRATLRETQT